VLLSVLFKDAVNCEDKIGSVIDDQSMEHCKIDTGWEKPR